MDAIIQNSIAQYGAIGALFVVLCFITYSLYKDSKKRESYILDQNEKRESYLLEENSKREQKYQDTINKNQEIIVNMTKSLEKVDEMNKDIKDLKDFLYKSK